AEPATMADAVAPPAPAEQPEAVEPPTEPLAPEALATSSEAASPDEPADPAPPSVDEATPTMAQIDAALAAGADEAVAGAFETIDDVLGGDAMEVAPPADAAPPGGVAVDAPADAHADAQFVGLADEAELAGDFASPDDLLRESAAS